MRRRHIVPDSRTIYAPDGTRLIVALSHEERAVRQRYVDEFDSLESDGASVRRAERLLHLVHAFPWAGGIGWGVLLLDSHPFPGLFVLAGACCFGAIHGVCATQHRGFFGFLNRWSADLSRRREDLRCRAARDLAPFDALGQPDHFPA